MRMKHNADLHENTIANLVLQDTIERIFVKDLYADIPRGIFLVRGENVLLLGEIVCALLFNLLELLRIYSDGTCVDVEHNRTAGSRQG